MIKKWKATIYIEDDCIPEELSNDDVKALLENSVTHISGVTVIVLEVKQEIE
jgi:hypothetical protein